MRTLARAFVRTIAHPLARASACTHIRSFSPSLIHSYTQSAAHSLPHTDIRALIHSSSWLQAASCRPVAAPPSTEPACVISRGHSLVHRSLIRRPVSSSVRRPVHQSSSPSVSLCACVRSMIHVYTHSVARAYIEAFMHRLRVRHTQV